MEYLYYISYFFGGAFFTNALPHFISGVMGHSFQSPFAKPPGQGLSSSTTNVFWGFFNLVIGYILTCRVGSFDLHSNEHIIIFGFGGLLMGVISARSFGRFNGGS